MTEYLISTTSTEALLSQIARPELSDADREAAIAEVRRREQAAQRDLLEWAEADAESNDEMRVQMIDENIRLEAENERLRELLAKCVSAFDAVIDNQAVTDEQFAAIEAAKEIHNA